ncbi:YebG family protein [Thalassotalea atypica]|uniref:YebG family protein n=1 Tax=Thalassotalea atypica TaxID=2054316 RepID=UPI002572A7F7|nr:YebG family protein [Thalassotalea atypica]
MAVESRFVVIRNGVEVQTFMDKKAADEYDKMLDMADNLSEMLASAPIELSEKMTEELSIFFAQHREDVLIALQAKKPKVVKSVDKPEESPEASPSGKVKLKPTASKSKAKSPEKAA